MLRAQAIGLAPRRPVRVEFDPEGTRIICHYDALAPVSVAAEHLGALLVSHCIASRIPLPRLSEKAIRVGPGSVVLELTTHYGDI